MPAATPCRQAIDSDSGKRKRHHQAGAMLAACAARSESGSSAKIIANSKSPAWAGSSSATQATSMGSTESTSQRVSAAPSARFAARPHQAPPMKLAISAP
jgi:hypothetical protein